MRSLLSRYNPKRRLAQAVDKVTGRMICTECKHASNSHTIRHKEYIGMKGSEIFQLLVPTRIGPNFNECFIFECDDCHNEYLACQGHYDTDSCNGRHEEVERKAVKDE